MHTKKPSATVNANDTKLCLACNRPFSNRKKWSSRGIWDAVIYCSKACRAKGVSKP